MTARVPHRKSFFQRLLADFKRNYILYLLILPVVIYYIIFAYVPMYGVQLAFKEFIARDGIWGSPWIGFENFERFFSSYNFIALLKNTLGISVYSLVVGFPLPILFALLLNYIRSTKLKKTVQMVSYAPYFISTVVMCGMIVIFLQADTGIINQLLVALGMESVSFLSVPEYFKSIYVWTGVWQGLGWNTIIYISALSGVDYEMHEAAIIDGATKLRRMWSIDLPSILPTAVMLLILNVGGIMNVGFAKVYLLQNSLNQSASDVISTYVYRVGMINNDYGYSTAVGLFNSVINVILLVSVNQITKKLTQVSLW